MILVITGPVPHSVHWGKGTNNNSMQTSMTKADEVAVNVIPESDTNLIMTAPFP